MLLPSSGNPSAAADPPRYSEDIDSACSTPFVSAPSSPGSTHAALPPPSGYFYSAPASPMHHFLHEKSSKTTSLSEDFEPVFLSSDAGSFEFEFSSRFSPTGSGAGIGSMTSADELFFNGQIRPMKLSSHLQRPQEVADRDNADVAVVRGRDSRAARGATHRKARSMSPFRSNEWLGLRTIKRTDNHDNSHDNDNEVKENENESSETTPSCSASSSRSSSTSSGRNSKKWLFLKDLLNRSKSEGRSGNSNSNIHNSNERFWTAISFSNKDKKATAAQSPSLSPSSSRDEKNNGKNGATKGKKASPAKGKPANGGARRRRSAHELHYAANRAQAEEMKKKTFLPYRQGLLGCLGFSTKSYGAFSGFTKSFNPISSR